MVAEILGEREEQVESKLHEERGCTKSYVEVELHMELEAEHCDEKKTIGDRITREENGGSGI